MSSEIGPIFSGLVLGALLGHLPVRLHPAVIGAVLVPVLAILATITSGEFRLTWGFVLMDIPMVGVPACLSYFAFRAQKWVR